MRTRTAWGLKLLLWLLPLALVFSCMEPTEPDRVFISLDLQVDSLTGFDTVLIVVAEPDTGGNILDTLWHGRPPRTSDLAKVKVESYQGGDALVRVTGFKDGQIVYVQLIHYQGSSGKATEEPAARFDRLPPTLVLLSLDTTVFEDESIPDTLALCEDVKDGKWVTAPIDSFPEAETGRYPLILVFRCEDKAKNLSSEGRVKFRRKPRPDTLAPAIVLRGADSLDHWLGMAYVDSGASCVDQHDGVRDIATGDAVDVSRIGLNVLGFACKDSAGNAAASRSRKVLVAERPDTLPPVLKLKGADSLDLWKGKPYVDSGASCLDDRDGNIDVTFQGDVDTGAVGRYLLTFACQDKAGNAAKPLDRVVRVVLSPDTLAPVLALKGADSLSIFVGDAYVDSGATCTDLRDGEITATVDGAVDADVPGRNVLAYLCKDKAGNEARTRTRVVIVAVRPDILAPILKLKGADSMDLWKGKPYVDSGATCLDDRDGEIAVTVEGAVDTGALGRYLLTFACQDKAGNAAKPLDRVVRVVLSPDTLAPVLTLKGADSLSIFVGDAYVDSGATCTDLRDGEITATVDGAVDAGTVGLYLMSFTCKDKAGNAAPARTRKVRVILPPDVAAPVLALIGRDTARIFKGTPYADSGSSCLDARDGSIAVSVTGSVLVDMVGTYTLTFNCKDQAGNAAIAITRTILVAEPPDTTPPFITLKGVDSLDHIFGTAFIDSGATCADAKDGALAVVVTGSVNASVAGRHVLAYACKDAAGNPAPAASRVIWVVRAPFVDAHQETIIDSTNNTWANSGSTPMLTFGKMLPKADPWATVLAFDVDKVDKGAVKSAKATFQTYISGNFQAFDSLKVAFTVHRVLSPWVEGDGGWYYHDGAYDNDGDYFLANYPIRPEIAARAKNPSVSGGLTGAGRAILRVPNMAAAGTDTVVIRYGAASFSNGGPGQAPPKPDLVQVEIDLTEYVLGTPAGQDYGLVITSEGVPNGIWINWATRELGDGTMGPRMNLEY